MYQPASITSVEVTSPFYCQLDELMRKNILPAIIDSLRTSGRLYALTWTPETAKAEVHPFWDSDVYKTLEACCYFLLKHDELELEAYVDEAVRNIKSAVWKDGYINSYYTVQEPTNRWTNLRDMHELYQLGHLAEASCAYYLLTGKQDLINVVRGMLELVRQIILPKGGYPGHQELEIGLLRLYDETGDQIFLDTAGYFIRERGKRDKNGETYFDREAKARGGDPYHHLKGEFKNWFEHPRDYAYMQAHVPLVEQQTIEGHSVRAMYWLTAAQHYTLLTPSGGDEIKQAVQRLFNNTVNQKMYLTGGIGAKSRSEGFGPDYWLPDQHEGGCCYSETCASFALIILCGRLLQAELKGIYGDTIERALLNTVLGAVGMKGGDFYYENPLTTLAGHAHKRSRWFEVACCPPNVAKLLGLLPTLTYSVEASTIAVHLFLGSSFSTKINGQEVYIQMETNLPWEDHVQLSIKSTETVKLAVRIPSWTAKHYTSSLEGEVRDGYLYIDVGGSGATKLELDFPTAPRFVYAHPTTRKDEVAVMRGPLVYCAEGVENDFNLEHTAVLVHGGIKEVKKTDIAGIHNVPLLEVVGKVKSAEGFSETTPYADEPPKWEAEEKKVTLLPYFLRMNRGGNGAMRVWLKSFEA